MFYFKKQILIIITFATTPYMLILSPPCLYCTESTDIAGSYNKWLTSSSFENSGTFYIKINVIF